METKLGHYGVTRELLIAHDVDVSDGNLAGLTSPAEIVEALEAVIPKPCDKAFIRLGGDGDGGYILPDDLDGIRACFSPGVNNFKWFEDELANTYGIRSFMCDYSSDVEHFATPLAGVQARYAKLQLQDFTALHLDEVEFFGLPVDR